MSLEKLVGRGPLEDKKEQREGWIILEVFCKGNTL
jgi:hypothetical protein